METKPTYEELEQRADELEKESVEWKHTERKLQVSEKRYSTLSEASFEGILIHEKGTILDANNRFAEIFGYELDELIGKDALELIPPKHRDTVRNNIASGYEGPYEVLGLRRDSSTFQSEIRVKQMIYNGRNVRVAVVRDITARKQAEEALRQQNEFLSVFHDIALGLINRLKLNDLLEAIINSACTLAETPHGFIYLYDSDRDDLEVRVSKGDYIKDLGFRIKPGEGISGKVWQTGEPLIIKDYCSWSGRVPDSRFNDLRAVAAFPLKSKNHVSGVIGLGHFERVKNLNEEEIGMLARFAELASLVIDNACLYEELQEQLNERKQAEEALRESEEKFRNIIEHSNEIFYIHDTEHILTFVSSTSKEIFGYTPQEMMRNWTELITDNPINQRGFEITQKAIETGERQESYLLEAKKKDGTLLFLEIEESPVKDAEGKVVGIVGAGRDVTERKQSEEALRKSEEKYRELIEDINDVIFSVDINGVITYISPVIESVLGYHPSEIIGKNFIEFIHPEDLDFVMEKFKQVIYGELEPNEYRLLAKSDEPRWVRSSSRPIYEEGSVVGLRGVLIDISERKRLEAQLQHIQKMEAIGTLAGGVAHDFNNLMMGMLGNVSLVLHDLEPSHPHYEMLKHVDGLIQSGSRLTRQLLGFARKGKYEVKPASLNKIVKESSETFGRTRKEITIKHELAEELFAVEADETQIQQVLLNLYINSADAMPGGGNLFLQTLNVTHAEMKDKQYDPKPGNYVMIRVSDHGAGMDEKTMERIFDPFFTTKEMGRGTGLGLASAYGIIKGHGGYIDVDSKKGHGTTFYIYLPASGEKITETPPVSESFEKGIETILLVDDEEMVLDVGVKMLETMGYDVLEAKSGQEAIDIYKENIEKIDLVILDMIMPGIGGGEVFDKMKEINPDVNILLFSGYSIEGRAQEILDRGCKGFIQKPFNLEDLSQKIREILHKH